MLKCVVKFTRVILRVRRRRLGCVHYLIGILILVTTIIYTCVRLYLIHVDTFYNPPDRTINYLSEVEHFARKGFLLDGASCLIPNVSVWNSFALPYFLKLGPFQCADGHPPWTRQNQSMLMLNVSAVHASGYDVPSVSCCFKIITRQNQSWDNYNTQADELFTYSSECYEMGLVRRMNEWEEFIKVFCTYKYWPFGSVVVYKNYHAFTSPSKDQVTQSKKEYWKNKRSEGHVTPPSVVILGLDSVSRLSFHRQMPRVRERLTKMGGVFELKGYTKVAENTFPNTMAFHTGYYEEELELICYPNRWFPQDKCPFIWNRFSSANYWTGMAEDVPNLTGFNYMKTGFIAQPVDYYMRPFMLATHHTLIKEIQHLLTRCIGKDTVTKRVLNYLGDLVKMSGTENTPLFAHAWINIAHEDFNGAGLVDEEIADFLDSVDFSNTVLFFLSDHGFRYSGYRPSYPGWLEDRTPTCWVHLPETLRKKYPDWDHALRMNSDRLTTAFDVYHTLNHILDTLVGTPNVQDLVEGIRSDNGQPMPRRFGQSLFQSISSSRNCSEAGIPGDYCPCVSQKPKSMSQRNY